MKHPWTNFVFFLKIFGIRSRLKWLFISSMKNRSKATHTLTYTNKSPAPMRDEQSFFFFKEFFLVVFSNKQTKNKTKAERNEQIENYCWSWKIQISKLESQTHSYTIWHTKNSNIRVQLIESDTPSFRKRQSKPSAEDEKIANRLFETDKIKTKENKQTNTHTQRDTHTRVANKKQ